jgi:nicotinate dehydrogenase subunit A
MAREPTMAQTLQVNGHAVTVDVDDPDTPLLYVLRDNIGLRGPRFGCGLGQCGACTVHIDGTAVRSCVTPLSGVGTGHVVTLEGLSPQDALHPLQQAFIDEQAMQCGYCINGMIMQAASLLQQTPHPSEHDVRQALANNLCRCGTHLRILRAVMRTVAT